MAGSGYFVDRVRFRPSLSNMPLGAMNVNKYMRLLKCIAIAGLGSCEYAMTSEEPVGLVSDSLLQDVIFMCTKASDWNEKTDYSTSLSQFTIHNVIFDEMPD